MTLPLAPGNRKLWVYDIEVFPNHFLAVFHNGETWRIYDETKLHDLAKDLRSPTLVLAGFNNFDYDDIIIKAICENPSIQPHEIYEISKRLIDDAEGTREAFFQLKYGDSTWCYSIDVFQLLNGKVSLKELECKMGFATVVDSPADFDADLPVESRSQVMDYCMNDVRATAALLVKNWDKVVLRAELDKQYQLGKRVYCLSEQGVAQHTFLTLHRRRTNERAADVRAAAKTNPDNLRTDIPLTEIVNEKIRFTTPEMSALLEKVRSGNAKGNEDGTSWGLVFDGSESPFSYLGVEYQLGVGGLHSVDGPMILQSDDTMAILDLDVASYYPSVIIQDGLYPKHIGPGFLEDMRMLRDRRLTAKRAGNKKTADALKIVINATFGKLNDKWSPLRSIPDAMRVTVNGQLYLLMLIERLTGVGATVISANTDGVTVTIPRVDIPKLKAAAAEWENTLGYELETVEYTSIFRRDVNNYVAVTSSGKIKQKGAISTETGKGDGIIIKRAAEAYILNGIPPDVTIQAEEDPKAFLFYQRCQRTHTLYHADVEIGRTIRWYVGKSGVNVRRKAIRQPAPGDEETLIVDGGFTESVTRPAAAKGFTKIARSDDAVLAMDITNMAVKPADINYEFYEKETWKLITTMMGKADAG